MSEILANAKDYLEALSRIAAKLDPAAIDSLSDTLAEAWHADAQVLVFGNGGSATTASHIVTDLVHTASVPGQRRLRAISLVDNHGLTTAIANDVRYDQIFVRGLETYARSGDVAIGISGSGTSPNVVNACRWAVAHQCTLVCLTGFDGGEIKELADVHVNVPSRNYGLIEDLHVAIGHMISQALRARMDAMVTAAS